MVTIPYKDLVEPIAVDFIEGWVEDRPSERKGQFAYPGLSPTEAHVAAMQLSQAVSLMRIADALEAYLYPQVRRVEDAMEAAAEQLSKEAAEDRDLP